jgi:thiol-disulfide isomerase/thioredoxin
MAMAEIEPGSSKWGMAPFLFDQVVYSTGQPDEYEDYAFAVLRENENDEARPRALSFLLDRAAEEERESDLRILYAWVVSEYPESFAAQWARAEYDPGRPIRPGAPVPEFAIASLEDSTVVYSNETMLGQLYMMDYWATWCGPCIVEMPYLEAAYEKYKDDGFTILSLSFDEKVDDIVEFREDGERKMPWLHAFVEDGFGGDLATSFQVLGIPKPILIGADGTIVATYRDLNGEKLDATLAEHFGREPTATEEEKQ